MRKRLFSVLATTVFALATSFMPAMAQESDGDSAISDLPWQVGPTKGQIGDKATIDVPEGYAFLGAEGTRQLNEMLQNPPTGADEYTLAPKDLNWFSFFSFDDVGYVKDDEKLDTADILASIKEGTEASNAERRKRGWETMRIEGWSFQPQYDKQLNLLEWAILAEAENSQAEGGELQHAHAGPARRDGSGAGGRPGRVRHRHRPSSRRWYLATRSTAARSTPSSRPATTSPSTAWRR